MKAVLWDMDGTLVDSEFLHFEALESAMNSLGLTVPSDLHDRVIGMSAESVYEWLVAHHKLILGFQAWIAHKYDIYLKRVAEIAPFEGALELWQTLETAGVKQAVVSNSDRIIVDANLSHVGLAKPKLVTVSRNDVVAGKPDPEPYRRGAYTLGVDPSEVIVLEDSTTGANAGVAAGMATYFVPGALSPPPAGVKKLNSYQGVANLCGI